MPDYKKFIRPITNQEDAKFWAGVRIATYDEHKIASDIPSEIKEYIEFRKTIRERMISKLMFTNNTLLIMEKQKKGQYTQRVCDEHYNAGIVFEEEKANLLKCNCVAQLPLNCGNASSIESFISGLPSNIKIILLSGKFYGKHGQGQTIKIIEKISNKLNKKIYPIACQYNKQKGEMQHEMYFSSTIVMTFQRIMIENGKEFGFDFDPSWFPIFTSPRKEPLYSMSRRMDGAYPTSINPLVLWETKEYYDNKSYGSRVNDSIFETILSGKEINEFYSLYSQNNINKVFHYLFIDGYYCFGFMGKALLLRYIDCFFQNIVDDIIIGSDVVNRWTGIAEGIITSKPLERGYAILS